MRTLVLGGMSSGKSRLAEHLAADWCRGGAGRRVRYVATARPSDTEMVRRIARHRAARPADWTTWELGHEDPRRWPVLLRVLPPEELLLVDCLSLWVAGLTEVLAEEDEEGFRQLLALWRDLASEPERALIVVSLEVGQGLVPLAAPARRFTEWLGQANQALAACFDRVVLSVAGLPLWLKGGPVGG